MKINLSYSEDYTDRERSMIELIAQHEYTIALNEIRAERVASIVDGLSQHIAATANRTIPRMSIDHEKLDEAAEFNLLRAVCQKVETFFPGVRAELVHDA
jgi:hypothetical protein